MRRYVIKVQQYLNGRWVTLRKTKTAKKTTREEAIRDVELVQKLFMEYERVEISESDGSGFMTICVKTGPCRVIFTEAFFQLF